MCDAPGVTGQVLALGDWFGASTERTLRGSHSWRSTSPLSTQFTWSVSLMPIRHRVRNSGHFAWPSANPLSPSLTGLASRSLACR